jgi:ketosteroid isomerase-like protein
VSAETPANESVLRRSVEAWNANDWPMLESLWHSDGEIVAPEGWPEPGPRQGWTAIREQFDRIKGSWTEERVEVLSVSGTDERLLADLRWVVKGEASGAALEVAMWMLCDFRGDRFTRIQYFLDREKALAAAEEGAAE